MSVLEKKKENFQVELSTLRLTTGRHLTPQDCLQYQDKITTLTLSGLSLKIIPDWIFSCFPHLSWLDVRFNKLINVPVSVTNCRRY